MLLEVAFLLLFGACQAAPHEGLPLLNPGGIGGIFKGPDSETIIQGPDGSQITSKEQGGAIVRDDNLLSNSPIVVAEPEETIISSTGAPYSDSALASASPILASPSYYAAPVDVKPIEIVQQDPHVIETEIIEAPDVEPEQSSDLQGPSGRIITKGSASIVSGPASTTITEPRKIIVAPPKIAIGTPVVATATIPLLGPLVSAISASTVAPSFSASSTVAPPVLSYSTTEAPVDLGYSTAAIPLAGVSSTAEIDSSKINLGVGGFREYIPVIEYSSSNGVINGQSLAALGLVSSTELPILSSTIATSATSEGAAVPAAYLSAPPAPTNLAPTSAGLVYSTASPNIQRIARIGDNIAADGRVDMDNSLNRNPTPETYQLPQVLGLALSKFYQKDSVKGRSNVGIDDKMGELSQNEIATYDTRTNYIVPQDLSQARYLAPALERYGVDASQVNLAPVPYSDVRRLPDGAYQSGLEGAYLSNRYARSAKQRT